MVNAELAHIKVCMCVAHYCSICIKLKEEAETETDLKKRDLVPRSELFY